jgi:hypothetical protein
LLAPKRREAESLGRRRLENVLEGRANLFPVNFGGNQLQKRRDITATESCSENLVVSLRLGDANESASGGTRRTRQPEQMIQHLCAVAEAYRSGLFSGIDKAVDKITGIPPPTA